MATTVINDPPITIPAMDGCDSLFVADCRRNSMLPARLDSSTGLRSLPHPPPAPPLAISLHGPPSRELLTELGAILDSEAYAFNSQDTIKVAERRFSNFLKEYSINIGKDGISDADLRQYVIYLYSMKGITSYATIKNYITMGVRLYHMKRGMTWLPLDERPTVRFTLNGARRLMAGDTGMRKKLPITLPILERIRATLDLNNGRDLTFWTATLTAFFCLLRKANLCAPPPAIIAKRAQRHNLLPAELLREDVLRASDGTLWLHLRTSKTNQCGERDVKLAIPSIQANLLCPTAAMEQYLRITDGRPLNSGLFGWWVQSGEWHQLDHPAYVRMLKESLRRIGLDPTAYAGHSLRRGGATFAFQHAALDPLIIKAMGDWVSAAFMKYCEVQQGLRRGGAQAMATAVERLVPSCAISIRPMRLASEAKEPAQPIPKQ